MKTFPKNQVIMSPKILQRCTICKRFHASYLLEDPDLGKCYLCLSCWKTRVLVASGPPDTRSKRNKSERYTGKADAENLKDVPLKTSFNLGKK